MRELAVVLMVAIV